MQTYENLLKDIELKNFEASISAIPEHVSGKTVQAAIDMANAELAMQIWKPFERYTVTEVE